ncbi:hypothetical protein ACX9NE_00250 [Mycobacterium sp. ML4]
MKRLVRTAPLWVAMAVVAVLMAGTASAHSAAPQDPDAQLPTWPFAVGAIAAVAAVAIWSVRRRP